MTVAELIEKLKEMPQEAEAVMTCRWCEDGDIERIVGDALYLTGTPHCGQVDGPRCVISES